MLNGTVRYLLMGLNVHFEEHSDNSVNYYIHALGRHIARVSVNPQGGQKTYFYHADYLGSVRLVTDVTGAVVWSERTRPFGSEEEQSGSIVNDYRFTGKAWDAEAGLFYFNARWYDPETGRFISEDPLWGNIFDPQSLNRFAYGRNNPFRFIDPTGMIIIKSGVDDSRVKESITSKYDVFDKCTNEISSQEEAIITSTREGDHKTNSKHYTDEAVDLRGNNVPDEVMETIADAIQEILGDDYDVLPEFYPDNPDKDHIHIEYDPKEKPNKDNHGEDDLSVDTFDHDSTTEGEFQGGADDLLDIF